MASQPRPPGIELSPPGIGLDALPAPPHDESILSAVGDGGQSPEQFVIPECIGPDSLLLRPEIYPAMDFDEPWEEEEDHGWASAKGRTERLYLRAESTNPTLLSLHSAHFGRILMCLRTQPIARLQLSGRQSPLGQKQWRPRLAFLLPRNTARLSSPLRIK